MKKMMRGASVTGEKKVGVVGPGLLSGQVSGSRYFFLNLSGGKRGRGAGLAFGGREHCNPDYRIDRASFAYALVEFIAEGAGWVRIGGGKKTEIGPGSVVVCRGTTALEMAAEAERPMVKYFLCLAGEAEVKRLAKAGLEADRVTALSAHGEVRSVLDDLVREGQRPGSRAAEICGVLFELLLLKLGEVAPRAGDAAEGEMARENFLRCKALFDEQAERLMTLEQAAAEAQLDVSSVCRLFRRFQGISPYQYLLRRKMNLAAEFLVDGRGLVKEAAQRVGFADPYHFSRCFKAVHGVAPSGLQRRSGARGAPQ
jgi:AraC family transcriptional regulator